MFQTCLNKSINLYSVKFSLYTDGNFKYPCVYVQEEHGLLSQDDFLFFKCYAGLIVLIAVNDSEVTNMSVFKLIKVQSVIFDHDEVLYVGHN